MKIMHVVRRFGPVGGMERYVWETAQSLRDMGHEVSVLCEQNLAEKSLGITVHELGTTLPRPRWLALLLFGRRVKKWLARNPHSDWVIHSHERLGCHQVTTFHGPPFATIFEKHWTRLLSLRVFMHLFLEQRELSAADSIVPVSLFVMQQLVSYYPWLAHKLKPPILPGVKRGTQREFRPVPADGGVVGFVGKEWQRKGLPFAAAVIRHLRRKRPNLVLVVIGPRLDEVQHLFAGWNEGYRAVPWAEQVSYPELDVLLHPARAEPFGMVIGEAMCSKVPVVVSDVCGAARVVPAEAGSVLPLSATVEFWADAVDRQLSRSSPVPRYERDWALVAHEYEAIYEERVAEACAVECVSIGLRRIEHAGAAGQSAP